MGHATRSRVVIAHLLQSGHRVRVVVSGRAHGFLAEAFAGAPRFSLVEIRGLRLRYRDNGVRRMASLFDNLAGAPRSLLRNVAAYRRVVEAGFSPDVVISDFESWAFLYGLVHRVPVISIDNMQVLDRCAHPSVVLDDDGRGSDFHLAKWAVKLKLPGAYHYLVTSFFAPPVRRERTTIVPPLLRPEVLAARREPGDHVLLYQTASQNDALLGVLAELPYRFRVYGLGDGEAPADNIDLRPFSNDGFVDDLRTARAVIAGGGFSLMSEAVHLGVPMLSLPIDGQFEQQLNARYLAALGYGAAATSFDAGTLAAFLADLPRHQSALADYPAQDNGLTLACLDTLLRRIDLGAPPPDALAVSAPPTRLAAAA